MILRAVLIIILLLTVGVGFSPAQVVSIPDLNLSAAIEAELGKAADTITVADMKTLTRLVARNANISDLTGLEAATNLTLLILGPQSGETNSNSVSDISALAGLTQLGGLSLSYNSVSDISALAGLTNLFDLSLDGNAISDISPVAELTNLTDLDLNGNSVSDISALAGLTQLGGLSLSYNSVSDISALAGLTNLTELYLAENTISDLSPLAGLTNLEWLHLHENTISDISALAGLTDLGELSLWGNSITDISAVAGLTNLFGLFLHSNAISDISALAGLTNLQLLSLHSNAISDLLPLIENLGLGSGDGVSVFGNPLGYLSIHTHIPALQGRGINVQFDNQAHPVLLKILGDDQKGVSSSPLSDPFVIEVQDENGSVLAGISVTFAVITGGGTLSVTSTTTDANGRAQSILTLGPNLGTNTVQVSADGIESTATFYAIAEITADVNSDNIVNLLDLLIVAFEFGNAGLNLPADVNGDGVVNIPDLVLVAGILEAVAAAPSALPKGSFTAAEVQGWLIDARMLEVRDPIMKRGIMMLEQLLAALTPTETELLANYPNPFNPETWIPYHLSTTADVKLSIYDSMGVMIRQFDLGHQAAGYYTDRTQAVYWNGRNNAGEIVGSGVYFYHLSAGEYSATGKMVILK